MDESKVREHIVVLCQRMEAAIRKLPILPDKEPLVPKAAALVTASADLRLYDLQHRPRGDKKAIRQLDKLARNLKTPRIVLKASRKRRFERFCDEPPGPEVGLDIADIPVGAILAGLREQALLAKAHLEAKPVKKRAGAPPDHRAAEVANRALGCYEALTGKLAGVTVDPHRDKNLRTGEFLDFLTDVFFVLGISASPEYQAEQAKERRSMGGGGFMSLLKIWELIENTHPDRKGT